VQLSKHIFDYGKKQTTTLGISENVIFANDDVMKYVIGALQQKLSRAPHPLFRLCIHLCSCFESDVFVSPVIADRSAVLFNLFVIVEPLIDFRVCHGTPIKKCKKHKLLVRKLNFSLLDTSTIITEVK